MVIPIVFRIQILEREDFKPQHWYKIVRARGPPCVDQQITCNLEGAFCVLVFSANFSSANVSFVLFGNSRHRMRSSFYSDAIQGETPMNQNVENALKILEQNSAVTFSAMYDPNLADASELGVQRLMSENITVINSLRNVLPANVLFLELDEGNSAA
jgi:hypothetical protein